MTHQLKYLTVCLFSVFAVACGGDDEEDSDSEQLSPETQQAVNKLDECGLITDGRVQNVDSQCQADCISNASCDDLAEFVCDENLAGPAGLCFFSCAPSGTFSCTDGEEIDAAWQCDGEEDCADGSDEAGCSSEATFTCDDGEEFPAYYECDQEEDCDDGSDEVGCAEFICE